MKPSTDSNPAAQATNQGDRQEMTFDAHKLANSEVLARVAYERGMTDGMNSVRFIRCPDHRHVPQQHAIGLVGQECAVCVMERALEKVGDDVLTIAAYVADPDSSDEGGRARATVAANKLVAVFRNRSPRAALARMVNAETGRGRSRQ